MLMRTHPTEHRGGRLGGSALDQLALIVDLQTLGSSRGRCGGLHRVSIFLLAYRNAESGVEGEIKSVSCGVAIQRP